MRGRRLPVEDQTEAARSSRGRCEAIRHRERGEWTVTTAGEASKPRGGRAVRQLWMGCLYCLEVLREAPRGGVCQSGGPTVEVTHGVERVEEGLQ